MPASPAPAEVEEEEETIEQWEEDTTEVTDDIEQWGEDEEHGAHHFE